MSSIIKFDIKELRKLVNDKNTCVIEKKVTQNLALQPWCLGNLKESIKNLLDYKIGKFDKEFNGILLSYKNLRILQNVGTIRNDDADVYFQVQADYFIFQPYVGATLTGIVNKKSTTHLGILVHRVFNVVIPRPTDEIGNRWIGTMVKEGQEVTFQIVVQDLYGALPYIRGELDERKLELDPDGDNIDEIEFKSSQSNNVSYVDFEKTKPHIRKQIGDGIPHESTKTNFNSKLLINEAQNRSITKNMNPSIPIMSDSQTPVKNGKPSGSKTKCIESDLSITEKRKTKRQSRVLEACSKPFELNPKTPKKHKKDE